MSILNKKIKNYVNSLLRLGYEKVSNRMYQRNDSEIVYIKSIVKKSNYGEINYLNLNKKQYNYSKGKNIKVIYLVLEDKDSDFILEDKTKRVYSLQELGYKNKKQSVKRYRMIYEPVNQSNYKIDLTKKVS